MMTAILWKIVRVFCVLPDYRKAAHISCGLPLYLNETNLSLKRTYLFAFTKFQMAATPMYFCGSSPFTTSVGA